MSESTVLITGSNRGIGLEFTRQYLRRGWRVIATARRPETLGEPESLPEAETGDLLTLPLDVTDPSTIESVAEELTDRDRRIDLLINNAGVLGPRDSFPEVDPDEVIRGFQVNCLGPLRVTKGLYPRLREGSITIAMITSRVGSIERNDRGGMYPYRLSKAALNMLGKNLSLDLDEGSTVLLLHPGWVQTELGGPDAQISPGTAVEGMIDVIRDCDASDSGRFYDYTGEPLPW